MVKGARARLGVALGLLKPFCCFVYSVPFSTIELAQLIRREAVAVSHSNVSVVPSGALAENICGVQSVWHVTETFANFPVLRTWYGCFLLWSASHILCPSSSVKRDSAETYENIARTLPLVATASIGSGCGCRTFSSRRR